MIVNTTCEAETLAAAAQFAATLKPCDIVVLYGDLGTGKSVFCRAVLRALCDNPELDVPSPTYTLVQTYDTPLGEVWHFDLYRLKDPEELYEIGWEDALFSGVLLIEWPDRLGYLMPKQSISVTLAAGDTPTSRTITIERSA